jgi:hypothetical protein
MVGDRQVLLHLVELGEGDDRDRVHLAVGDAGLQRGVDLGPGQRRGWPPSESTIASCVGSVMVRIFRPFMSSTEVFIGRCELENAKKPPESIRPSTLSPVLDSMSPVNFLPKSLSVVDHPVGHGDVRKGEGNVEHADQRIVRGDAAGRGDRRFDDAVAHLLDDLVVLAQLAVGKSCTSMAPPLADSTSDLKTAVIAPEWLSKGSPGSGGRRGW